MLKINGHEVKPTIFPDKTGQVWKLPDIAFQSDCRIEWEFESDAEVFYLMQLLALLESKNLYHDEISSVTLFCHYLPYARQDKLTDNESTFALGVLGKILEEFSIRFRYFKVVAFDPHSNALSTAVKFYGIQPKKEIADAIVKFRAHCICFPDKGAEARYANLIDYPGIGLTLSKDRNQSTGEILGLKIVRQNFTGKPERVLIIDDICDGGRTFIEAAKVINDKFGKTVIGLYVSHGIFSKGIQCLLDAGIEYIYTSKGVVYEPVSAN